MNRGTTGRVASGEVTLATRQRGDPARPTVVLVHGFPDTGEVWAGVADGLSARFHVVTYDVRGAGDSSAPRRRSGYRLELLVEDLAAVADAVSPHRPFHLVGHDWGSIQGWEAVTSPLLAGRVASFTSISGPPLDHAGQWARERARRPTPANLAQLGRQAMHSLYAAAFHLPGAGVGWRLVGPRWWPVFLERVEGIDGAAAGVSKHFGRDAARGLNLYRANFARRLLHPRDRATGVPTQVIVLAGDRYILPVLLDGIERTAPNVWVRRVPGRHWLPRTQPESVAGWIGELIDQIEGRSTS